MADSILYLECSSGISGDMTVAALLDLGADEAVLRGALSSLPLEGYSIEIKTVYKSGLKARDFRVVLAPEYENHDHDMEYLYGNADGAQGEAGSAVCGPDTGANRMSAGQSWYPHPAPKHLYHNPEDFHSAPEHAHHGRNLDDVLAILRAGDLTPGALALAERIFTILAKAEAQVHGKPVEEIHFHEVGAVDSIVDIAAAAVCLDNLHPDHIVVSALTDGTGQVRCQHGLIPVPAPAVTAIAAQEHLRLHPSEIRGELVTPTGAAIAAAIRDTGELPEEYSILRVGLGAGKREYAAPGVLRAMLLRAEQPEQEDVIMELQTNVDDCSGEALSFTLRQLMAAGALDAFCVPVYMKKGRPAWLLEVLCDPQDRTVMEELIFRNTTTIGIRRQEMHRTKLEREIRTVETPWGAADIKCCRQGKTVYYYPENDSICRLAVKNETGFPEMYGMVQAYVREQAAGESGKATI